MHPQAEETSMSTIKKWNHVLSGLSIGLVFLLLFLLFHSSQGHLDSPELPPITDFPVSSINAIAINHSTDSIGLILHPTGIELLNQASDGYSQQKLSALVYKICHLSALRIIHPSQDTDYSLSQYGLDTPSSSISLIPAQGETMRFYLGNKNPIDGSCYAKTEHDDTVYLISPDDTSMLTQSLSQLRILDLYPPLAADQLEKLEKLQVTCDGRTWSILRGADDSRSLYHLSEPVQLPLDWQTAYKKIMEPFLKLVPDTFLSDFASPSEYGLDHPSITLTAVIDGNEYVSYFSPADGDRWYCMSRQTSQICSIPAGLVSFMTQDYMEFLSNSVYSRNLADISSLTISKNGESQEIQISGDGIYLEGRAGNQVYDYQMLADFHKHITAIPAAGLMESSDIVNTAPFMALTFTLRNGQTDILEFLPVSDRLCAISVNGNIDFLTYTSVLRDIVTYFEAFTGKSFDD